LRIGIDGLHLSGPYGGVQNALARTVTALRKDFPTDELFLYVPRDFNGPPDVGEDKGLLVRRTFFLGRWRTVRTLWRNFRLQSKAYADSCDVLHGATYALPTALSMPAVVTIHDTIALSHPEFATPGSARLQKRLLPRSAQVARRVHVPTYAVKAEVERRLEVKSDKIDVVPWGVGGEFCVIDERKRLDAARKAWSLPEKFLLFVGTLEPKKNIEALIMGFYAAKMNKRLPHALVFAGQMGWGMHRLKRLIHEHNAREYILFTEYVPENALPLLYNLADLCILPSRIEGFGLPVLEAFSCGCPVLVSDAPALVEVAGGAAHVFKQDTTNPSRPLREALETLLVDADRLRMDLREKGLRRAKMFTWQRTAGLTRKSYECALG